MSTRYREEDRFTQRNLDLILGKVRDLETGMGELQRNAAVMNALLDGGAENQTLTNTSESGQPQEYGWVDGTRSSIVYFTDASGSGTITNKAYEGSTVPANKVLTAFESNNDDITVTLEVHSYGKPWQPEAVQVTGGGSTAVTVAKSAWTQVASTRIWTASVNLTDADTTGILVAAMSDGDVAICSYTRGLSAPLMLTAAWDGTYPASQTQVKSGDSVTLTGTVETHATTIRVLSSGATSSQQDFADDYSSGTFSISVTIGSGSGSQQFSLAASAGGTYGATLVTTDSPAIDLDQTSPTFGAFSVNYNGSQEAAKGAETFDVTLAHTNAEAGDTYAYGDPTGTDVTIPSTTTYAATKTGCSINTAGIYRDDTSTENFQLTATRTTLNGKIASSSGTVEIADVAPLVGVDDSSPAYGSIGSVARMGSDDGTNFYLDRNLYVISNQKHLSTSTSSIVPAAGDSNTFQGSWVEDDDFTFRRAYRASDANMQTGGQVNNTFTWITITVTNRAGTVTTSITKNPTYTIGGFAARTLTIPAWPNREADMSIIAVDTANLLAELLSKGGGGSNGGTDQTFDNSPGSGAPDDEVDKFCITAGADDVDDDGQFYYNKDQAAAIANSSGTAQVIVSESA